MRVLAYVNENPFWIDILKMIEKDGIEIGYVTGSPPGLGTFHDQIRQLFPSAGYHDFFAANRCEIAAPGFDRYVMNFDAAARAVWEEEGHTIVHLLSRIDSRRDFSYDDRREVMRTYLRFADYLITVEKIDGIVGSLHLHDPLLYVVGALFRRRGKPVITLKYSNFDGRHFVVQDDRQSGRLPELKQVYDDLLEGRVSREVLSEKLKAEFARIRGRDEAAIAPDSNFIYGWAQKFGATDLKQLLLRYVGLAIEDIRSVRDTGKSTKLRAFPTRYEKDKGRNLADSFNGLMPRFRHELWSNENRRRVLRLKKAYSRHISEPPMSGNYVFVPLHYQPELSSMPLGGPFADQVLWLETISAALPPGWRAVVKEHPAQHNPWFEFGPTWRSPRDYELMARLPNVSLVSTEANQFDLMERARAVVTITGTAGWEALLRGKPAVVFGDSWYRLCRGAYNVTNVDECRRAFADIIARPCGNPRDAELFAEALERVGLPPYVGKDGDWMPWVIDGAKEGRRDEMVARYAGGFVKLLNAAQSNAA